MDNTAIALKQLKQHGYRVTKQRESMVDYLGRNQHRYTAVTILDRYMRTQFPGVSHDTIYRNVKSFIEMGIVESRMEDDQIVVKLQCDFQHPHHHHFICTNCGKEIADGVAFCTECGTKAPADTPQEAQRPQETAALDTIQSCFYRSSE